MLRKRFSLPGINRKISRKSGNEVDLWVIPLSTWSKKCACHNCTRQNTSRWKVPSCEVGIFFKKMHGPRLWTRLVLRIRIGLNLTSPCDLSLKTLLVMLSQFSETPPPRSSGHSIHLVLSVIKKTDLCASNSS